MSLATVFHEDRCFSDNVAQEISAKLRDDCWISQGVRIYLPSKQSTTASCPVWLNVSAHNVSFCAADMQVLRSLRVRSGAKDILMRTSHREDFLEHLIYSQY